jgi:hypothetical protein
VPTAWQWTVARQMMVASTAIAAADGKRDRYQALRNAVTMPAPSRDRKVLSE